MPRHTPVTLAISVSLFVCLFPSLCLYLSQSVSDCLCLSLLHTRTHTHIRLGKHALTHPHTQKAQPAHSDTRTSYNLYCVTRVRVHTHTHTGKHRSLGMDSLHARADRHADTARARVTVGTTFMEQSIRLAPEHCQIPKTSPQRQFKIIPSIHHPFSRQLFHALLRMVS